MTTALEESLTDRLMRLGSADRSRDVRDVRDLRDVRWLERVLLLAVVLVVAATAWLVATAGDASGGAAPRLSSCVAEVVDGAQAFAAVLGDHRPVDGTFADRWCTGARP